MRLTSRQTGATVEASGEQARALVASGLFSKPATKGASPDGTKAKAPARKTARGAR